MGEHITGDFSATWISQLNTCQAAKPALGISAIAELIPDYIHVDQNMAPSESGNVTTKFSTFGGVAGTFP
jgi:hypothetical protein